MIYNNSLVKIHGRWSDLNDFARIGDTKREEMETETSRIEMKIPPAFVHCLTL